MSAPAPADQHQAMVIDVFGLSSPASPELETAVSEALESCGTTEAVT